MSKGKNVLNPAEVKTRKGASGKNGLPLDVKTRKGASEKASGGQLRRKPERAVKLVLKKTFFSLLLYIFPENQKLTPRVTHCLFYTFKSYLLYTLCGQVAIQTKPILSFNLSLDTKIILN
jgi:hypothetical protein